MPRTRDRGFARTILTFLLVAALALGASPAWAGSVPAPSMGTPETDRFLVKFSANASHADVDGLNAEHGVRQIRRIEKLGVRVMSVPKGKSAEALARAYEKNPKVVFAEPDHIVQTSMTPNDTLYSNQWALPKISAPAAWDVTTGSSALTIAVVDTGVESSHPDLLGRVVMGYDFANSDSDPSDDNGHGTAVAGIAAANSNNALGVAGMNWVAKVLAVKTFDSTGNGYTSNIADGIMYAADRGARVISMSFAAPYGTYTMESAIDYAHSKGCVLVAAAGNNSRDWVSYPAAYSKVIAVGATDSSDALASWCNYGADQDVVAPGVGVMTTTSGGTYAQFSGTSAATPFVSGLAGLVLAREPGLSQAQVAAAIRAGAVDLGAAGWDERFGWGRIDAARTLGALGGNEPPPPPPPPPAADTAAPEVSITSPSNGATVSRTITIRASASDGVGVARVDFFIDGVRVASDESAPWEYSWNTQKVAEGAHTLTAIAYDAAGNSKTSSPVTVTVSNKAKGRK